VRTISRDITKRSTGSNETNESKRKKRLSGWKSSGKGETNSGPPKYGPYLLGITTCDGNITYNSTHCRGPPTDKQTNKQRGRGERERERERETRHDVRGVLKT
jgi:hypothetical protein